MEKKEKLIISTFLLVGTITMLWGIDISISAMNTSGVILTDGFRVVKPSQIYHIALYSVIGFTITHNYLLLSEIFNSKNKMEGKNNEK